MHFTGTIHTSDYLKRIGVADIAPATSPFDPGYDPGSVASHRKYGEEKNSPCPQVRRPHRNRRRTF